MNPSQPYSLIFWKGVSVFSRITLWLVVAVWVAVILMWVALHWVIVPRIGELRPRLEIEVSKVAGVPVKIGDIKATSVGVIPSFELNQVALLDEVGREALKLPRILVSVSPASLLRFNVEQILIEGPVLDIRRDVTGKLTVAGLDFSKDDKNSGGAADWFFSQPEFVIRNGSVNWVDEMPKGTNGANGTASVPPPLTLSEVDFVSRNPLNKHELRFDATPPAVWGDRFSLRGMFTQSLLSTDKGKIKDWTGQIYADFSKIDVSELGRYINLNGQSGKGIGTMKAWTKIVKGEWESTTADVSLQQVDAVFGKGLQPLALKSMSGRLTGKKLKQGFEFATQNLQFQAEDGLRWPGGNLQYSQTNPTWLDGADNVDQSLSVNDLKADKLDLAVISLIANKLPLNATTHELLSSLSPQGTVETVTAHWRGFMDAPQELTAKGSAKGVQLSARHMTNMVGEGVNAHEAVGRPGFRGLNVDFDISLQGGKAKLGINKGSIEMPGIFEESVIPIDSLSSEVSWKIADSKAVSKADPKADPKAVSAKNIEVTVNKLVFKNSDTQGTANFVWRTSDPANAINKNRFPGILDLSAKLGQTELSKVWRYLPMGLPKKARNYVQDLLIEGAATEVDFKIKGDVWSIPAVKPSQGDFRIAAKFKNAHIAYVPKRFLAEGDLPWPELDKVDGSFLLDGVGLTVKSTKAEVVGLPSIALSQSLVTIPDLRLTVVNVAAQGKSKMTDLLGFVNQSALYGITKQTLSKTTTNGNGDFKIDLSLPIGDFTKTRVKGQVAFLGNDVQITPDTPQLSQAKGLLRFTEKGFSIHDAQAVMFGGEVKFDGGNLPNGDAIPSTQRRSVVIRGQGVATAQGLQQATGLNLIPALAKNAVGSTAYEAQLRFLQEMTEVSIQSNLQGLALNMPAPFSKNAQTSWPMKFDNTLQESSLAPDRDGKIRPKDTMRLNIDKIADLRLVRDISGETSIILRGTYSVGLEGAETTPEPSVGITANINVERLDVDQWTKFLASLSAVPKTTVAKTSAQATPQQFMDEFTPSVFALRARDLIVEGRSFENIVIGGSRDGAVWRANMQAKQLSGYVEYRLPNNGNRNSRIYARLAKLAIGESQVKEVEKLLDEQPTTIPTVDLVVEDFELKGRKFGRIEIDAENRLASSAGSAGSGEGTRVWRLNKLNISTPEAKFSANGFWAYRDGMTSGVASSVSGKNTASSIGLAERRTTGIDFKLDITNAGELLDRFGFKGVVSGGKGKLDGQLNWRGSPMAMNFPTLSGLFNVQIDNGQFLKVEPGISKLLSILSMQSIVKRLTLDFRDVFSEGFVFDLIRGDVSIDRGIATSNNIQISGANAVILMDGKSDISAGTQDMRVVYAPEVNAGIASLLVATAINPAIGIGTFLAQLFLRQPLIEAVTKEFKVVGTWSEPLVIEVKRTVR